MLGVLYFTIKKIYGPKLDENYEYDAFCKKFKDLDLPEHKLMPYAVGLAALRQENSAEAVLEEFEYIIKEWSDIEEDMTAAGGVPTNNVSDGKLAGLYKDPFKKNRNSKMKVFQTNSNTYSKAIMGKKKYESYDKYIDGELGKEISEYAKKNPKNHIVLQDKSTGAMVFLRKKK